MAGTCKGAERTLILARRIQSYYARCLSLGTQIRFTGLGEGPALRAGRVFDGDIVAALGGQLVRMREIELFAALCEPFPQHAAVDFDTASTR